MSKGRDCTEEKSTHWSDKSWSRRTRCLQVEGARGAGRPGRIFFFEVTDKTGEVAPSSSSWPLVAHSTEHGRHAPAPPPPPPPSSKGAEEAEDEEGAVAKLVWPSLLDEEEERKISTRAITAVVAKAEFPSDGFVLFLLTTRSSFALIPCAFRGSFRGFSDFFAGGAFE